MRTLEFEVNAQKIRANIACDFSGLVPGTQGYLKAKFNLSRGWAGCAVAASFWCLGKEYPVMLDSARECVIPAEALKWKDFAVSLTGKRGDYVIRTGRTHVKQEG